MDVTDATILLGGLEERLYGRGGAALAARARLRRGRLELLRASAAPARQAADHPGSPRPRRILTPPGADPDGLRRRARRDPRPAGRRPRPLARWGSRTAPGGAAPTTRAEPRARRGRRDLELDPPGRADDR